MCIFSFFKIFLCVPTKKVTIYIVTVSKNIVHKTQSPGINLSAWQKILCALQDASFSN